MSLQRSTRSPIVLERGVSGRVKWFDFWKGYGFITRDDGGQDVFLHASAIVRKVQMHFVLIEGQKLEFDIIDGEKGREAAVVSGPGGIRVGTAIRYNPQQQQQMGNVKNFKRNNADSGRQPRPIGKQNNKGKIVVAAVTDSGDKGVKTPSGDNDVKIPSGENGVKIPRSTAGGVPRKGRRIQKTKDTEKVKNIDKKGNDDDDGKEAVTVVNEKEEASKETQKTDSSDS